MERDMIFIKRSGKKERKQAYTKPILKDVLKC